MSKALIITEKPSVAKDIVGALGGFSSSGGDYWESKDYVCTYAVGHLLELLEPEEVDPIYKRWALDTLPIIPESFDLKPKSGQNDRLRVIKKLINRKDVNSLINACDSGREGELIFRELVKYFEVNKPIRRLWLQSMTPQAIRQGFTSLQEGVKFEGLAAAAECRSLADWLIGMNASRALTIRLRSRSQRGAWSAGRVQTPSLALLVRRELEVLAHVPEPYWLVIADFSAGGHSYQGSWFDPQFRADETKPQLKSDRIFDEHKANQIVRSIRNQQGLASETRRPDRSNPPPLFDLTSLQRTANSRFGWSAKRTLGAAQRCYESHKVLTYPRTDSRCLPSDYGSVVEKILVTFAAGSPFRKSAQYLIDHGRQNDKKIFDDKKISDHFAIIPTGQLSSSMQGDDQKLFDLVCRRFLAAFHPPAIWEKVERKTVAGGHTFITRGRFLQSGQEGWLSVYGEEWIEKLRKQGGSNPLPALIDGQDKAEDVTAQVIEDPPPRTEEKVTKPPPRIGEAGLLLLMENAGKQIDDEDLAAALHEKGLGTPATRADIIENLKHKDYVDDSLRPTVKGMRLIDVLERIHADRITSAELTGELELHLREVEHGGREKSAFLSEIIDYTKEIVEAARNFDFDQIYPDVDPLGNCPLCSRPVYERSWFYRCKEDPEALAAENDCPLRIWKDKSGRFIDRKTAGKLLSAGKTGELEGFRDRRGRTYKAELILSDGQVTMKPVAGSEQALGADQRVFEVNPEPLGLCPIHENGCQVIETPTDFICQERKRLIEAGEKKPTGPVMPREVCKREMTREEVIAYIQKGETPLIEDFISKYGRPFKAKLKMRDNGTRQFEFPPREGGTRKKKSAKKKTPAKASTKKSSTKKKTAKKKTAARQTSSEEPF